MSKSKGDNWGRAWTMIEVARLKELRLDQKMDWDLVALHMPGRSKQQCQSRFRYEAARGQPREGRQNIRMANVRAPERVLIDARRRANLDHPTLTALLCGDPLPGYSALDRPAPPQRITLAGRFSAP